MLTGSTKFNNLLGQFKNFNYICYMKKGDKIKDIKNGSIHIIESIESFDDNTVIFTEDSKCLPIENVSEFTMCDEIEDALIKNPEIVSDYLTETCVKPFEEHMNKLKEKYENDKN